MAVVEVQALAKFIGSENESNMSGDVGGGVSGVGKSYRKGEKSNIDDIGDGGDAGLSKGYRKGE